jgi:integrase/recombinase XerC
MEDVTIQDSINNFLVQEETKKKLSPNTVKTYSKACSLFADTLNKQGINSSVTTVVFVSEEWIKYFLNDLKDLAPNTVNVYVQAVKMWYRYIAETYRVSINLNKLKSVVSDILPNPVSISPIEPDFNDILTLINYVLNKDETDFSVGRPQIRFLRDKAIILTLADTGLSVETICSLSCRDVVTKKKIIRIEKRSGRQDIDTSRRAYQAIVAYLGLRSIYYQNPANNLNILPLFARHDQGAGSRIVPITSETIRNIIKDGAKEAFQDENLTIKITPVWFRYYYEKTIAQSIEVLLHPKILERSQTLFQDGHYENAVFNAMKVIEEEIRKRSGFTDSDIGVGLISAAMGGNSPRISFSLDKGEQDAAFALYRGAIGYFKNPSSHRFIDSTDQVKALECLAFGSLLMRMLDEVN